jgi:hypothetical protein
MVDAMDEALDAYVATRVAATLAWSRLTRELAVAAAIQAKMPPAQRETTADESAASVDETLADGENEDAPDTGDDPWFIPRPEWQKRPDGPFKGFNSPHGRF